MMLKSKIRGFNQLILRFFVLMMLLSLGMVASLSAQTRIMALGDSITGSPGCWRAYLDRTLRESGYNNIDFVGTQAPQGCGFPYDGEHEGHGGVLATNVADQNQLVGWLNASNPDVVLMHFGTNDVWNSRATSVILAAFTKMVGQMRANNPAMIVLVAQIIPMDASRSCSSCYQGVINLNNAIPAWADGLSTSQSPVIVVDQWTGFDYSADTYDGVHPNDAGNRKIAAGWIPALAAVLSGTPVVTPTPPPLCTMLGDVNGDSKVSVIDALMTAQYSVSLNPSGFVSLCADVNCDGRITIVDALVLAQYTVGLVSVISC